ncbi:MAG: hypothetical protein JSU87_03345 [Gemmatimonadota bacterium]|nr:MAG: hypothetical protein JSU87_03345 [Gemmatimonadota bacterium]
MRKVQVWAEISDQHYHAYELEAQRRGVPLEELVEQTVNCLLRELEREENECSDPDQFLSVS